MNIKKRSGKLVPFDDHKILIAMKKAFIASAVDVNDETLQRLLNDVKEELSESNVVEVEEVQDVVEKNLMENGFYEVAKNYILYRSKRQEARLIRKQLLELIDDETLEEVFIKIERDFPNYSLERLLHKYQAMNKDNMTLKERLSLLTRCAAEMTDKDCPDWEKIAGRLLHFEFHKTLKKEEEKRGLLDFYAKLQYLTEQGLYGSYILESYSKKEIETAYTFIDESRNDLFTYAGLDLLISRYLIRDYHHVYLESVQEMYLGISLHLAMKEEKNRLEWVKKFYDMMSTHKVTMATPTQSNARKPYHQLSSCFIDTVSDSLDGIYHSISQFAQVSKYGGGMGMYLGKVRSRGGSIRGFDGASGGVIRWIRVINDTAVAVDQLGVRQGAVAVYLDVWHRDLPEFLMLKTNNGDDRMKAHDVFPAICYPDYFWKLCKEDLNQNWYLMDPHEILMVKGYALEDSFGDEWEEKYKDCVNDARIHKRTLCLKEVVRMILRSAVETGTPFAFNRDEVNRANPNKHKGMIYCSNLCTEIAQNMSETTFEETIVDTKDGDPVIVQTTKPGDFVVCNLASLCLGNIDVKNEVEVQSVIHTVVRALDNVIDLNFYPVLDAKITNQRYRAIGLGTSGYHHMLAKNGIMWESEEHLKFVDEVYEMINYYSIEASCQLSKERGSYSYFEGSEWSDGTYFTRRHYESNKWKELAKDVEKYGMRNGWLLATAPTSSTSILIGTSAGLDPIMNRYFLEEKKGAILPRVAPDLSPKTWWYYKSAHDIDQTYTVKAAGIRQRHIDQSQSVNLWITNEYKMSELLHLYILAYECGVKTIYYVRSKALEVESCESCSA